MRPAFALMPRTPFFTSGKMEGINRKIRGLLAKFKFVG
jgi:hypothetical protein